MKTMAQLLHMSDSYYKKLEKGERRMTESLEAQIQELFIFKPNSAVQLEAKVDWISLHFRTLDAKEVVERILHLQLSDFLLESYSRHHYDEFYKYGQFAVYASREDHEQGVLIELTGQGCREMEQLLQEQGRTWYDVFNDCVLLGKDLNARYKGSRFESRKTYFNVTRCDIALDEYYSEQGNYNLMTLAEKLDAGLVATSKRKYSVQRGSSFSEVNQENKGITIYVGSPSSTPYFRFYAKDAEQAFRQNLSVEAIHELYGFKNRYEVVLRHKKADAFIRGYVRHGYDLAQETVGIINANLTVFDDFKGHLDAEWYDLMHSTNAYQFTTQPKKMNVAKTWRWAEKNVFPTLAFLKEDNPEQFKEFLDHAKIPKRYENYLKIKHQKESKGFE
jgi:phage replication initiation protein